MKIFELVGKISLRGGDEARGQVSSISDRAVEMGRNMRKAGAMMTAAGGAIVGTATAMVNSYSKAGDEIHKAGLRTGFSADALSRWRVVAQRAGTDLNAVETGVKRMQRSIIQLEDGLAESSRSFDRLGLSLEDIQNLQPEEQMRLIMERMADIEDPTRRAAVAQEIFGRSGTQLLPVLEDGAEGLSELMKVAEETGEVFTEEGAKSAAEYRDAVRDMRGSIRGLVHTLAVEMMPIIQDVVQAVQDNVVRARQWIEENRELVGTIARVTLVVGGLFAALGPVLMGMGQLLMSAKLILPVLAGLGKVIVGFNPVLLGLAAAVAIVIKEWEFFRDLGTILMHNVISPMIDELRDMASYTRQSAEAWKDKDGIMGAVGRAYEAVTDSINGFVSALTHSWETIKQDTALHAEMARARQRTNWERVQNWREVLQLEADADTESKEQELEREREHNEEIEEIEREHRDRLDDMMEEYKEKYGEDIQDLIDVDDEWLDNLAKNADSFEELQQKILDELDNRVEEDKRKQEQMAANAGSALGDIIDGNINAAISGLIRSYFQTLPGPIAAGLAAAAPSLVRRLMPSPDIPGLAEGGTVRSAGSVMVGERGPEILDIPQGARVTPLERTGDGGGVTVNIQRLLDVENLSPDNVEEVIFRLTQAAKDRIPSAIEYAKRQGGLIREVEGQA